MSVISQSEQLAADKARLKGLQQRHLVGSLGRESQFHLSGEIGFLLGLIKRLIADRKRLLDELSQRQAETKNYAANCAMLQQEPDFCRYVAQTCRVSNPDSRADMDLALKAALQIESRKQLNTDPEAASRWLAFRKGFENWKRNG